MNDPCSELLWRFLSPAFGGMIAGGVGLWLASRRRVSDAKDVFGVFIREKVSELKEREVAAFYFRTKPNIKDALHRHWHYLNVEKRTRIDRLWQEYDSIPPDQLDAINENDWAKELEKMAGREFQHPHEIVRYYLDEFYKFAA